MIAILAGEFLFGQDGFMIHLDTIQAGKNGSGRSIREVDDGYLLFCRRYSESLPAWQHVFVRRIGASGELLNEFEHREGEQNHFDIGYIDPISTNNDGTFSSAIAEAFYHPSQTWFYTFGQDGDTISRKFVMTFPVEDSVTHAFRQTRPTADGGHILCGFIHEGQYSTQAYLVRLTPEADTLWTQRFGLDGETNVALGVAEAVDGDLYIAGYTLPAGNTPSFLIRTDANGNQIWRREFGMDGGSSISLSVTDDGHIVTLTMYRETWWPSYWYEVMLTKWDTAGAIVWQERSHYGYVTSTYDLEILDDGFVISGMDLGFGMIAKFDQYGDSLWSRRFSVSHGEQYLYDVEPTSDGGFIATGLAYRYPPLDPELLTTQIIWVIKTDSMGCVVPGCHTVGVQEYVMDLNEHLKVWPVPTDGILNLELPLPLEFDLDGPVQAILLDPLGREVGSWPVPRQNDVLRLQQHLPELSSGTYYLHLKDQRSWLAGAKLVVE